MALWRPSGTIRVIAIGLAWKDGRLLATEVTSDDGVVKGVRPIGGSIEYGERREEALIREFREELDTEIAITGGWHAIENIFEHEGAPGHEIVFASDIEFLDRRFYDRDEILYRIENGSTMRAVWVDPALLSARGIALYPARLAAAIGWA